MTVLVKTSIAHRRRWKCSRNHSLRDLCQENRESWDVSKQHKEAITARIILLIFRLENYRPLGVKSLTKNLTMAQKTVTQVGNELGCHLNKTKNASGSHDVLELKLPLFKPRLARSKIR